MPSSPLVRSFYNSKISPRLVESQSAVFKHLDIPLQQDLDDSQNHAGFMEAILRDGPDDEIVVIADIDAFPMTRRFYAHVVETAAAGEIIGLAQVANHKDPTRLYAGPMFLAVKRGVYRALGSPAMSRWERGDVAQKLTDRAQEHGVEVDLIYPSFAIQPLWALSDVGVFGIGTFYGKMDCFHLFQSRKRRSVDLFCAVAEGVIHGRLDFGRYLKLVQRRRFLGLF